MGYRYFNTFGVETAFPFGFVLSYTIFPYENLSLSNQQFDAGLTLSIDIVNTGKLAGKEVVSLYIAAPHTSMDKPSMELKGFANTKAGSPGERQTLHCRNGSMLMIALRPFFYTLG
jgi:beta-glucosidase